MRKTFITAGITGVILCALAAVAVTGIFTPDNFTSYERRWQPAPTGYQAGKDNGSGIGTHHPGEDCGICHKPGGKAPDLIIAGTLYRDRLATQVAEGGEIILEDLNGKVISMVSNVAGNFWSMASIGSYPYTVGTYHGHAPFVPKYELYTSGTQKGQLKTPADPTDSLTWKYKAWVKSGTALTPMMSVAGVGGGVTAPRMSCNMHHAGLGSRGGLWTGSAPTLRSYPQSGLSYKKHIFPILRSKCAPCHIPGATHTGLGTKAEYDHELGLGGVSPLEFSSSLDLMTFDGSSVSAPIYNPTTGVVIGTEMVTKRGVKAVIDPSSPSYSPLLVKTTSGTSHGGGVFWGTSDADYMALRQWITEGGRNN